MTDTCGGGKFKEVGVLVEDPSQPVSNEDLLVDLDVPGDALLAAAVLANENVLQMFLFSFFALRPEVGSDKNK